MDRLFATIVSTGIKLRESDVKLLIPKRLKDAGFQYSPSQPITRGDGNCFLYAMQDQLRYEVL